MADRYWVGGTGTWDAVSTANWSATSGGASGASVPTTADRVFFNAASGAGTCTLGADGQCTLIALTGYTGTIDFSTFKIVCVGNNTTIVALGTTATFLGNKRFDMTYSGASGTRTYSGALGEANSPDVYITAGTDTVNCNGNVRNWDFTGFSGTMNGNFSIIYGDLVMSPTMTTGSSTNTFRFFSTSGTTRNITTNGVTFNFPFLFDGIGGSWQLQDNITFASARGITLSNGTLSLNNQNVTSGFFFAGAGTKTLDMGSGVWTITSDSTIGATQWNVQTNATNLTIIPGTATINMAGTSGTKTFAGAGRTYGTLNQGGAGALTITGANTFANITNTVQPATITFPANTITTVSAFSVSGTSGNQITLNSSTAGTRATLSDASGQNSVSFCTIKDINATGGAIWSSFTTNGNVDDGNNIGWDFSDSLFRYIYTRRKNKVILPL
jgi:hypothetical protein